MHGTGPTRDPRSTRIGADIDWRRTQASIDVYRRRALVRAGPQRRTGRPWPKVELPRIWIKIDERLEEPKVNIVIVPGAALDDLDQGPVGGAEGNEPCGQVVIECQIRAVGKHLRRHIVAHENVLRRRLVLRGSNTQPRRAPLRPRRDHRIVDDERVRHPEKRNAVPKVCDDEVVRHCQAVPLAVENGNSLQIIVFGRIEIDDLVGVDDDVPVRRPLRSPALNAVGVQRFSRRMPAAANEVSTDHDVAGNHVDAVVAHIFNHIALNQRLVAADRDGVAQIVKVVVRQSRASGRASESGRVGPVDPIFRGPTLNVVFGRERIIDENDIVTRAFWPPRTGCSGA